MKVFAIGDLHMPFHDKAKVRKMLKLLKKEKPSVVIQLGDLFDQYMFSRYDNNLNVMTPKKELEKARELGKKFWADVKKAAPKAELIQLIGNHDIRILKQSLRKFPEVYHLLEEAHKKLYTFKGVTTYYTDRDYVEIDEVVYCHGWAASHINHFHSSVVRAHDHKTWLRVVGDNSTSFGGLIFKEDQKIFRSENTLFELSAGVFADEKLVPFGYVNSRRTNWEAAIAIITEDTVELRIIR